MAKVREALSMIPRRRAEHANGVRTSSYAKIHQAVNSMRDLNSSCTVRCVLAGIFFCATAPAVTLAQTPPRALLPIELERSAEAGWLRKPVLASRTLDDMTRPDGWRSTGTGAVSFPAEPRTGGMRVLRVDMQMFRDAPAPTRSRLSSVNLRRAFDGEDWRAYNRLSLWIRPEVRGFPMLPLQIVLHNDGTTQVLDKYYREGIHYVTLANNKWTPVSYTHLTLPTICSV